MTTKAALQLKELADRLLLFRRPGGHSFVHFTPQHTSAHDVLERLRQSSLTDLLLPAGASLSIYDGGNYFPDLGLVASDDLLREVGLTALGWDFAPADNGGMPGWGRELELSLWYGRKIDTLDVKQVLSLQAFDSRDPTISRSVWAAAYAETGYEGHHQQLRSASGRDVLFFLDLIKELFATTTEGKVA